MEPKIEREVASIRQDLITKQAECEAHQARTDKLSDTLLDTDTGLVVRLVRIETSLDNHKTTLAEIKDGQAWILRGVIGILLSVLVFN